MHITISADSRRRTMPFIYALEAKMEPLLFAISFIARPLYEYRYDIQSIIDGMRRAFRHVD